MTTLLEIKEKLIRFYGKNEIYLLPVIKFVFALFTFLMINNSIGYMKFISRTPVALILALVCSVIPVNGTIVLAALVSLLDFYALSLEVCLVGLLLFAVIYFIYFRFAPKSGFNAILTPICFKLHIPYIVPVGTGLLSEAYSVVSVACGTVLYFFIRGVGENANALGSAAEESDSSTSKIVIALNQLVGNKEMYLVLVIFVIAALMVYLIRRLDIEHAWTIALMSGILFEAIGLTAGYILLGISGRTVGVIAGSIASGLIAFLIEFLFFNLDYSRT